jgi:predicted RNA-binding Zn-ribbon protein involved in translation (DUF1610 family)
MIFCRHCGRQEVYVVERTRREKAFFTEKGKHIGDVQIKGVESHKKCPNCGRKIIFLPK